MNSNYKTAIIGPKDVITGFKALGVVPIDVTTGDEALAKLQEIKKGAKEGGNIEYAVILLIEHIANEIPADELAKISRGPLPAIVILPGLEGSTGAGVAKLKKLAERAVGSDILG